VSATSTDFDLSPDPRILPMLGEINLAQWRCLAELIDNSVDGFLAVYRASGQLCDPEIGVNIPLQDDPTARVTVTDNGPGMTPERLEMAMRAGWSGNNPISSLGMFGMGFNIATARLGTITTVWTSQAGEDEEHGLRIDFDELRAQGHFRTPRLSRPKIDPLRSGTSVTIERLKPEQRAWFGKPANRSRAKREISRAYSTMLRENGVPISFKLVFNGIRVLPEEHCVWDADRFVETTRHGTVSALQMIDTNLADRPFCTACWQWLAATDSACPACKADKNVVQRKRRVHGWIGLQRYLSSTSYGIDFIRNGRKIEIGSRDLFFWRDGEQEELEYPIDDPRTRGRFVGEIHLDHCRVTYTKDRFDRTDPAWDEMVVIVRGEGPLQPQKASALGYSNNQSPLFKLYQAFRRSSPPNARAAGGWRTVLAVKDNDRAEEMAKSFHDGVPEYQTDQKWWELVQEEDNKLLTPEGNPSGAEAGDGTAGTVPGFGYGQPAETGEGSGNEGKTSATVERSPTPPRDQLASLTREFIHEGTNLRWNVIAYEVQSDDPVLGSPKDPWSLRRLPSGDTEFFLNPRHAVFRSVTMTELDALLCELSYKAADFLRNQPDPPSFSQILADLRDRYGGPTKLDPLAMTNGAELVFRSIAKAWAKCIDADDSNELFGNLPMATQEAIHHRMAARAVMNPQSVISAGRFLEYAPPGVVVEFIMSHPELFFDGRCWEDTYSDLDYIHPAATEEARARLLRHYEALLADALWLSEIDPDDLELVPRARSLRATLAIELLAPSTAEDDDA
jgi:hypothetical protein